MRRLACAALFALIAALSGCKSCGKSGSERTRVVVSIFPVYDLVRRVAGPDADVTLVLPPGRSEHSFEPTPRDLEAAGHARLVVMVGGLDPWMEKVWNASPGARLLKVADRVPTLPLKHDASGGAREDGGAGRNASGDDGHGPGNLDPHVWLDPQRAQLMVRAVAEELGRADGSHALAYRRRATELDQVLVAVDKEADERLKALKQKALVTFHDAFGYFAERYGLDIVAVIEPVPGTEPDREHLSKVLTVIKEKKVPALFREPQLDPRPATTLAEEARIPLGVLDPLGGGPETDTYEKIIRFDLAQLEAHLK